MPVKNTSQRQAAQGTTGGADGEKKEKAVSTVSFEVFQSEAATFQNIGEFRKAINSYTRVSMLTSVNKLDMNKV